MLAFLMVAYALPLELNLFLGVVILMVGLYAKLPTPSPVVTRLVSGTAVAGVLAVLTVVVFPCDAICAACIDSGLPWSICVWLGRS